MTKTAIVTGGAGGIGKAIAKGLCKDGWDIALVDVAEAVHETAADLGGRGFRYDITDQASRAEILANVSGPGALVNCAGIVRLTAALDVSETEWRQTLETNLNAPFFLTQEVARSMTDGGAIVNIASVSGIRAGFGRMSYGVSKAALIHMTKQFALELAPRGITCNAIAPGPVEGEMARVHPPDQVADYLKTIPAGPLRDGEGDRGRGGLPLHPRRGPHHRPVHRRRRRVDGGGASASRLPQRQA